MSRIPKKLREDLAADPFYTRCCISGDSAADAGEKIEWHHNLIFAGRQVQARFAILPIKKSLHDRLKGDKSLRAQLDWIMLSRASDEELTRYSKANDLHVYRSALNVVFGKWSPVPLPTQVWG